MKIARVLKFLFCYGILTVFILFLATGSNISDSGYKTEKFQSATLIEKNNAKTVELEKMNQKLLYLLGLYQQNFLRKDQLAGRRGLVDSILLKIEDTEIDSLVKSNSFYFAGVFYLIIENNEKVLGMLKQSYAIRESLGIFDLRGAKTLYNLGLAYRKLGDFYKMQEYDLLSINQYRKIYGESGWQLIDPYNSLISAYIDLQETDKALEFSNKALAIAKIKTDSISPLSLADLYSNIGVCYSRVADFSMSKLHSENAEYIREANNLIYDENYINLINSLAITYDALGLKDKSQEFYQKGVALALAFPENTSQTLNIINSYAINLANSGKLKKAVNLFTLLIDKAKKVKGNNSQLYYEVLNNYADFLREYNLDNVKAVEYNEKCMDYLRDNPEDLFIRDRVYVSYSLSLSKAGEPERAIKYIQDLIAGNYGTASDTKLYGNPDLSSINSDKISLKIFKAKYNILSDIYGKTNDIAVLKAAASTSELIISLIEKIRINIGEEESRLLLGDKYRELYFNAIRDYNSLYIKTSETRYLNKAFEYSERSKVAGLLASTRELKASQFQIPSDLAEFEFRLKRDLGTLNAMISEETNKKKSDKGLIRSLNEKVLKTTHIRDSLISVFEKQYPGYYSIKYNTNVASIEKIPQIVGQNGNYINYIVSDNLLYIFVANRKFSHLTSIPVDTAFFSKIKSFRTLLSMPASTEDAASQYIRFQKTGYELYRILIEPVRSYLISDKIIISPDNILSYIPFETLPTNEASQVNIRYRSLHYMMEDFDISYTYSATFMAESVKGEPGFFNKTVAFAPNYSKPIDINRILMSRQEDKGILLDLPFARQEAEYVSEITNGSLYENSNATETAFKNESGRFDILHLAMHTLLNDKDPMRSTLIFSPDYDSINDGYLKTYEVYGLPLKAKMVVLSSCNTGTGFLSTGEGVLSLARGFIYSGSQSVVMSMWEIEDRSGTEIIKMFYKNLKKGFTKSESLRKARIEYLKNSDMLRSHPYFWSALVIYGNNEPLYYSRYLIWGCSALGVIISVLFTLYFRKRKYS